MRVDVKVGITFHLGAMSGNQYGRLDIGLLDIDPEKEIEPQIESGVRAAAKAFEAATKEIDRQTGVFRLPE